MLSEDEEDVEAPDWSRVSHIRTVRSAAALARRCGSRGFHATCWTSLECPFSSLAPRTSVYKARRRVRNTRSSSYPGKVVERTTHTPLRRPDPDTLITARRQPIPITAPTKTAYGSSMRRLELFSLPVRLKIWIRKRALREEQLCALDGFLGCREVGGVCGRAAVGRGSGRLAFEVGRGCCDGRRRHLCSLRLLVCRFLMGGGVRCLTLWKAAKGHSATHSQYAEGH